MQNPFTRRIQTIDVVVAWLEDNPRISLPAYYFSALWGILLLVAFLLGPLGFILNGFVLLWPAHILYDPGSVHFQMSMFGPSPIDITGYLLVFLMDSIVIAMVSFFLASMHGSYKRAK